MFNFIFLHTLCQSTLNVKKKPLNEVRVLDDHTFNIQKFWYQILWGKQFVHSTKQIYFLKCFYSARFSKIFKLLHTKVYTIAACRVVISRAKIVVYQIEQKHLLTT